MHDAQPTHLERLPILPFTDHRIAHAPGMQPLDLEHDWLWQDAAFAPQMALRDALVTGPERETVFRQLPEGIAASEELLATVLGHLARTEGYTVTPDAVTRPDGVTVVLDDAPLALLGRLVQEDFLVLERGPGDSEHRLTGGILCFPSRWSLEEKMARGLLGIHEPVPFYADTLARRVQRFFDAIKAGRGLWRANWLLHTLPELHQPRKTAGRKRDMSGTGLWLRVERQSLTRLPETGAVIFVVKTDIAPVASLSTEEAEILRTEFRKLPEAEFAYKGGEAMMARFAHWHPETAPRTTSEAPSAGATAG